MKGLRLARSALLLVSLLVSTTCLPLVTAAYLPGWYEMNCRWHGRCERLGTELSVHRIHELVAFLRYSSGLPEKSWTRKETFHLTEVRRLLVFLMAGAAGGLACTILFWDRLRICRMALVNVVLIASATAILPFFRYFWREIFHGLLFDNPYWINTPQDTSYYITPRVFFFHTLLFIMTTAAIANFGLFLMTISWSRGK